MVDTSWLARGPQVQDGDGMSEEQDGPFGLVRTAGPQLDRVAGEGFGYAEGVALVMEQAAVLDPAQAGAGWVGDRGQGVREAARAGLVAAGRDGEGQGLVGAVGVVGLPPAIECGLAGRQIGEGALRVEQLGLEGAVEALLLALGLRVVGPPVGPGHPQAPQPDPQWRIGMAAIAAPG